MHLSSRSNWVRGTLPGLLLAHPALAAAATASSPERKAGLWGIPQFVWDSCEELGWQRTGTPLLIAAALAVLLLWPIARKIAGREKVLTRTTLFVGNMVVLSTAFLALGYFVARSESIILLTGWAVICVAVILSQTRHLYEADREEAFGILGSFLVTFGVALYGTEMMMGPTPWTEFFSKSSEERGRVYAAWQAKAAPQTAVASVSATPLAPNPTASAQANPATPPPVAAHTPPVVAAPLPPSRTGPDLQALYAQLQKMRAELDMNDATAVARFNEQVAAYQQEKAYAAATPAPRAVPVKAGER